MGLTLLYFKTEFIPGYRLYDIYEALYVCNITQLVNNVNLFYVITCFIDIYWSINAYDVLVTVL